MELPREFAIPSARRRRPILIFAAASVSAIVLFVLGVVWPSAVALVAGLILLVVAYAEYTSLRMVGIRFILDEQRLVVAHPDALLRRGSRQRLEVYELSEAGLAFEKGMYWVWSADATHSVAIPFSLDGYDELIEALQSRLQEVDLAERKSARLNNELKQAVEVRYGSGFGKVIATVLISPFVGMAGAYLAGEGYREAINSAMSFVVAYGGMALCSYLFYVLGPRFHVTERGVEQSLFRRTVAIPFERIARCSFKRRWGVNVLRVESESQSIYIWDVTRRFLPLVRTLRAKCPNAWPLPSFPIAITMSTLHPAIVFFQYLCTGVCGMFLLLLFLKFFDFPPRQSLAVVLALVWLPTTAYIVRRWNSAPRQVTLNKDTITVSSRRETKSYNVSDLAHIEFENNPTDQKIVLRFSNDSGKLVLKSDYLALSALEIRDALHLLYPGVPWRGDPEFDAGPLTTARGQMSV